MSYYFLADSLQRCTGNDLFEIKGRQYVAVLTTSEWVQERDRFDIGIELEIDTGIFTTRKQRSTMSRLPERFNFLTGRISGQRSIVLPLLWMKKA